MCGFIPIDTGIEKTSIWIKIERINVNGFFTDTIPDGDFMLFIF